MRLIPYGRQTITQYDIDAVTEILKSDFLTQGPAVKRFEDAFSTSVGSRYAISCASGTSALHLCALAAGLRPGDRVLTTPVTFVATANCVSYAGAHVKFADIDRRTLNLSPESAKMILEEARLIGKPFKAIITVDFAGNPCRMEEFSKLKNEYDLIWIQDACHSLGATWTDLKGRMNQIAEYREVDMTGFSFHPVKHITTGEGGMVATHSEELARRLKTLRTHGIVRQPQMFKAESEAYDSEGRLNPWYYEMQELGFNFRMSDIQAALGFSQLSRLEESLSRRRKIVEYYHRELASCEPVGFQHSDENVRHAYHLAVIRIDFDAIKKTRAHFMEILKERGIGTQVHYIPIPMMPYYAGRTAMDELPETGSYYRQALSIPCFPAMSDNDVEYVVHVIKETLL